MILFFFFFFFPIFFVFYEISVYACYVHILVIIIIITIDIWYVILTLFIHYGIPLTTYPKKCFLHSFQYAANSQNKKKSLKTFSTLFNKLFFNLSLITKNVTVKSFIIFQVFLGGGKKEKIDPRACHYYLWSLSRHFKFCSINRFCYNYFND